MNQVLPLYAQLPVFLLMSSLIYGQISRLLPSYLYMYKKSAQYNDWGILSQECPYPQSHTWNQNSNIHKSRM